MLQTYLFTDIEGSTRLWEQHPQAMRAALAQHDSLLHKAITAHQGQIAKSTGDGLLAAFPSPKDAIQAALDAQKELFTATWEGVSRPLRVRMGLHTGESEFRNGDYYGTAVNRAARLMAIASGGQTLISSVTADLARDTLPAEIDLRDLGEHRLKDLTLPERIFQATRPGLPADFPPLPSPTRNPTNLPSPATRFIGRETVLDQLLPLLTPSHDDQDASRVITLTGPGGIGKTRLALRAGAACLSLFPGGIWWVELAPLSDPDLLPQTVLNAVGLTHEGSAPPLHFLLDYFKTRTALLILDNCEHLVGACAQLVDSLLVAAPRLRVLATSRETLGLPGETSFQVPPLGLSHLYEHSEAVRLFVERAAAAFAGFALTETNIAVVVEICSRLDGLPLAIELAAARVKVLTVEQIAQRLDDRFRLLTGGSRTALPRQQTLRALVDWSWDLLDDSERTLLARLSVFAGGWTLEAAEAIGEGDDVLDLLYSLANKSLIVVERAPGQAARYRMLETIRQYAAEKLALAEDPAPIRTRHRNWFLALAEEAEPALRTHAQLAWLTRLDAEYDNLRAALEFSLSDSNDDGEAALCFAGALKYYWKIRGYFAEGLRWTEAALQAIPLPLRSRAYARALLTKATMAFYLGDMASVDSCSAQAFEIFRDITDRWGIGQSLYISAGVPFIRGDHRESQAIFEQSLAAFKQIEDEWGIGTCFHCLAHVAQDRGDYASARKLFEDGIALLQEAGDRWEMNHPLTDLAWETWLAGEGARAKALLSEHLAGFEELGDKTGIVVVLSRMVDIALTQGDYRQSRAYREQIWALNEQKAHPLRGAWRAADLGQLALLQNDLGAARRHYEESLALFQQLAPQETIWWLYSDLGRVAYWQGDYPKAETLIRRSLDLLEKMGNESDLPDRWLTLGDILRRQGDLAGAERLYRSYLEALKKRGALVGEARGLEGLAKLAGMQGDPTQAVRLFGAARALRERLGTPLHPVEQEEYDQHLSGLKVLLGEDVFSEWVEA